MKLKRAKKIVGAMTELHMAHMGLMDAPSNNDLEGVSLQDMIDANKRVRKENHKPADKDGSKSIMSTHADRSIAAIYAAINFTPSTESIVMYKDSYLALIHASDLNEQCG